MKLNKKLLLDIAVLVFFFSAFMDFGLWLIRGYEVPAWTLATMSLCFGVVLYGLNHYFHWN